MTDQAGEGFKLAHLQYSGGENLIPTATVRLIDPQGKELEAVTTGVGSVDAVFEAINAIVGLSNTLKDYAVGNMEEGIDSRGKVDVTIATEEGEFSGLAEDSDIVVGSGKAFLQAVNEAFNALSESERAVLLAPKDQ